MIFEQTEGSTKFIFAASVSELKVTRYYNATGKTYTHKWDMNDITVGELAHLVERFKQMPTEMWDDIEPEMCDNFSPPNVSKGIRRRN